MDNHYHLIMRPYEIQLSKIMHRINSAFSRMYNQSNSRTGHVYEKRYKAILVRDDRYLLSLLRYVHQNPLKANICKDIADYQWSSDASYRKNSLDQLVDSDFILNIFSLDRDVAIREYRRFMDSDVLEDSELFENTSVIGERVVSLKPSDTKRVNKKTLDDILIDVTEDDKVFELIKNA